MVRSIKKLIREESLAAMGSELSDGGCEGFSMEIGPDGVRNVL
jgi:NitT/TauT family transport system ATP-binding protein